MWTRKSSVIPFRSALFDACCERQVSIRFFSYSVGLFFACHLQSVDFCAFLSQFKRVFVSLNRRRRRKKKKNSNGKQNLIQLFLPIWHCVCVISNITCCSTETKSNSVTMKPLTLYLWLVYCHKSCVCFNWQQIISFRCVLFSLCLLTIKIAVIFSFNFSSIHLIWALV